MRHVVTSFVASVLFLGTLCAPPLLAQSVDTGILGVVRDSTGGVIPGATVTVTNKSTGVVTTVVKAPGANLVGRWDVTVEFFCGKSGHTFFIEKQDGNWLRGSHKGTFALREMVGSIEGNEVKFKSNYRIPGDAITSIFHGTLSGDTISGDLDMGEYLTGKFTAKRYIYPTGPTPIVVPTGPPQAS